MSVETVPKSREETAMAEVAREARQYRSIQIALSWPVVTNTAQSLLDRYTTLKKEAELVRPVLGAAESVLSAGCRRLLVPASRAPLLSVPLRLLDTPTSAGLRLVQRAMPQLTDTQKPVRLDSGLLLSLLLLPLSLTVALSHTLLEAMSDALVSVFPQLRPAAAGFTQKNVVSQWLTLCLMMCLYLPVQLLSHPAQTVRQAVSVPSCAYSAAAAWLKSVGAALAKDASQVADWLAGLPKKAGQTALELAVSCGDLAKKSTALAVTLVRQYAAAAGALVRLYTVSALQLVRHYVVSVLQLARHYTVRSAALVLALLETVYYGLFVATGLSSWLQPVVSYVVSWLRAVSAGGRQLMSGAAGLVPAGGLMAAVTWCELPLVRHLRQLWCGGERRATSTAAAHQH